MVASEWNQKLVISSAVWAEMKMRGAGKTRREVPRTTAKRVGC